MISDALGLKKGTPMQYSVKQSGNRIKNLRVKMQFSVNVKTPYYGPMPRASLFSATLIIFTHTQKLTLIIFMCGMPTVKNSYKLMLLLLTFFIFSLLNFDG